MVHPPAFDPQQFEYLAVAVAAIALGKADHSQPQIIIVPRDRPILHRAACETDDLAGPPLGRIELLANINHCLTEIGNRQALGFK